MYPLITFKMVKKEIFFNANGLSKKDNDTIVDCLTMIEFGMGNALITFIDKYYKYGGLDYKENRGLTIGGYESAWLADLVASYVLDSAINLFSNTTNYYGIYRDDGIIFLEGKWQNANIEQWHQTFQAKVNDLVNSDNYNSLSKYGYQMKTRKRYKL